MRISISHRLMSNLHLHKIAALLLGYGIWHVLGDCVSTDAYFSVPLSIQNTEFKTVNYPKNITIKVRGLRKYLNAIDVKKLTVVILSRQIQEGKNNIEITAHDLGLPHGINLIHYKPRNIIITAEK